MIAMELNQLNVNQTSTGGSAAVVGGPQATGIDHEDEEYQRGHGDGIAWAREYATVDELRDLVERYEPDRSADVDGDHSLCDFASDKGHTTGGTVSLSDSPHWRGFVAGAEEVLDERASMPPTVP